MGKIVTIITTCFLLGYYIFTSGLIFELTKSEDAKQIDTPYSIALSNYRMGILGTYNEDDVACAKWLIYNTSPDIPIHVDYLGISIILDFDTLGRYAYDKLNRTHYVFLTSWNTEQEKMVYGWYEGSREHGPLPDLSNAKEVFRRGNAVVYEVK